MNLPYFEHEQAKNIQIEILSICNQRLTISNNFEQIIGDFLFGVMTCYKQEYTTHYCQPVQNYLALCDRDELFSNALILIKIPLLLNGFFNYLDNNHKLVYRFEYFLYDIKKLINNMIYQHTYFNDEILRDSWLKEIEIVTTQIMIEGVIHQLSFNQDNIDYINSFLAKISCTSNLASLDMNDLHEIFDTSDSTMFIQTTKKLLELPYQIAKFFKLGHEKDKAIYMQNNDLYISTYCLAKISYAFLSLIINHDYFHSVVVQEALFDTVANELVSNQTLFLGSSPQFPSSLIFKWITILFDLQQEENLSANLYTIVQSKLPSEFKCAYFFESKSEYDRYLKSKQILTYPLHEFYQFNLPFELLSGDGIAALWPLKIVNTMAKMPFDEQQAWLDLWKHTVANRVYINNIPDNHWLNMAHDIHKNLASDSSQKINQWLIEILEDIPRRDKPFSQRNEKIVCGLLWFASLGESKVLSKTIAKYAKFFQTSINPYGTRSLPIAKISDYCLRKWQVI